MKKNLLFAGLLMVAATMGCTDDTDTPDNNQVLTGETGFVKVAINLPSVSGNSVKANGNDNFDDGIAAEYNVNDITLAFFAGADEASATCTEAVNLSLNKNLIATNTNVTVKYSSDAVEVTKPGSNQKLYAFAIINHGDLFSVSNGKLMLKSTEFTGRLADLNATAQDYNDAFASTTTSNGNFLMTNSPITDKASATAVVTDRKVTTLVPLTIYDSKAAAEHQTGDAIYVERAAAKVTMQLVGKPENNTLIVNAPTASYNGASVKFEGWALNNTNTKFFPARNVSSWETWATYYVNNTTPKVNRFFGETANPYRVYWAIDPNYEGKTGLTWTNDPTYLTAFDGATAAYCAENTTTAEKMLKENLTQVVLKAKFTLAGAQENDNLFMGKGSSKIYSETAFLKEIKDNCSLDVVINTAPENGTTITTIAGVQSLLKKADATLADDEATTILNWFGSNIKFYKGGVMYYYTTTIKHFGDDPTAFDPTQDGTPYSPESKFLGRFGVVRNNWYDLTINSVTGPGEPEIPDTPDPDEPDKVRSYINVEINVLSWAKRTQSIDL